MDKLEKLYNKYQQNIKNGMDKRHAHKLLVEKVRKYCIIILKGLQNLMKIMSRIRYVILKNKRKKID